MFLETLIHNSSLKIPSVVPLEHSISIWEDRRRVLLQLVCSDVQLLHSVQGLLYYNHRSQRRPKRKFPPPACVWHDVHWGSNRSPGRRFWKTSWCGHRRDGWQIVIHLTRQLSLTDTRCSSAQCRRSWQWCLFSRGTWVGRLPCSPISNNVRWTVCSDTFLLRTALYWAVSWATVWLRFCFTKRTISDNLFVWKRVNVQHHVVYYLFHRYSSTLHKCKQL